MSGICGIVNLDGAPVDRQLLDDLTAFLAFRGPDAQATWIDANVGFGHAMLRTTFEAERERQPLTLDGRVWITADARIDGWEDLKRKLDASGRGKIGETTDPELILHAYHAWGERCVEHLIGDFAFAIWDGPRRRLFCARDHFGVKPFFYARVGRSLVFSNTLNCVRRHPAVSDTLNDLAIADFLLFEMYQDPAMTAFADIRRLPPSHSMIWSGDGLKEDRYWELPTDVGVRFPEPHDYVERFQELFQLAVRDRLRTDRIGLEMSGGLDSTSVAATAASLLRQGCDRAEINACSVVFDRLVPDDERYFSGVAANSLGLPIHYTVGDDYGLFERRDQAETQLPEPVNEANWSLLLRADLCRASAPLSRVFLTGWDGDTLLNESLRPYCRLLLQTRQFGKLTTCLTRYALAQPRSIPRHLWNLLRGGGGAVALPASQYPVWLNPDLERNFDLRARWEMVGKATLNHHATRPKAFRGLSLVRSTRLFDSYDSSFTRMCIDYRHPMLDVRLVEYCLSLPSYPWCTNKQILRDAMRGLLPEEVRVRPKTPAGGLPYMVLIQQPEAQWLDQFSAEPELSKYVCRDKIPSIYQDIDIYRPWINMRPLSLSLWLGEFERFK